MARVQYGPAVSSINGKVGGVIFQRNAFGATLRTLSNPIQARTMQQGYNRARMAQLQTAWQQLTAAQRSSWDAWAIYMSLVAEHAKTIGLSGQHAYLRTNFYRQLSAATVISNPVFTPLSVGPYTLEVENASQELVFKTVGLEQDSSFTPIVSLSFQLPPASLSRPKRVIYMQPTSRDQYGSWLITIPYTAAFGELVGAETMIWAEHMLQQTSNGALTAWISTPLETTEL